MALAHPARRKSHAHYRFGTQRLPHPSWRQAVGGVAQSDRGAPPTADEFWAALGL